LDEEHIKRYIESENDVEKRKHITEEIITIVERDGPSFFRGCTETQESLWVSGLKVMVNNFLQNQSTALMKYEDNKLSFQFNGEREPIVLKRKAVIEIKEQMYNTVDDLISVIEKALFNICDFDIINKDKLKLKDSKGQGVQMKHIILRMDERLKNVLGIPSRALGSADAKEVIIKPNLNAMKPDAYFIYSDIIAHQIVGNTKTRLLYVMYNTHNKDNSDMVEINVNPIQYVSVAKSELSDINILITDGYGIKIPFHSVIDRYSLVVLHFRRRIL
jgi:hypothetical protein